MTQLHMRQKVDLPSPVFRCTFVPIYNLCCAIKLYIVIVPTSFSTCQCFIYYTAVTCEQSVDAPSTDSREASTDVHPPTASTDSRESSADVHPPTASTDSRESSADVHPPTASTDSRQSSADVHPPTASTDSRQSSADVHPPTASTDIKKTSTDVDPSTDAFVLPEHISGVISELKDKLAKVLHS